MTDRPLLRDLMTLDLAGIVRAPERLGALRASGVLERGAEPVFERLTSLAHDLLGAPLVMVTLVDADRQFFKSFVGLPEPWASRRETPLSHSFCQHTLADQKLLVVENAPEHPVLRSNPAIAELGVVSYAGVPLVTGEGHALGAFCVTDSRPRCWTEREIALISELARSALLEIELRTVLRRAEKGHEERLTEERHRTLAKISLGLRHEINNALGGLLLTTDLLESSGADPTARHHHLNIVRTQALRVAGVLERLDDIAALETRTYLGDATMIDVSPAPRQSTGDAT